MAKNLTSTAASIVKFLEQQGSARAKFYDAMVAEGLTDWKLALPHCHEAVVAITGCRLVRKERGEGFTLDQGHKHYNRAKSLLDYLRTIWRGEGNARNARGDAKTDPVEKLVAAFGKLSKAEQRRFFKAIEA